MKTLSGLLLATALALALAAATDAAAYTWSPPNGSVHLHGRLTFTPNEGSKTHPFTCSVTMDFKPKPHVITAVRFPREDCEGVEFEAFPWDVYILQANAGSIGGGTFLSGAGICVTDGTQFQDNGAGVWTLPAGQCLSGTLTSNPPTTIVP
jgi:hypothetical protein